MKNQLTAFKKAYILLHTSCFKANRLSKLSPNIFICLSTTTKATSLPALPCSSYALHTQVSEVGFHQHYFQQHLLHQGGNLYAMYLPAI